MFSWSVWENRTDFSQFNNHVLISIGRHSQLCYSIEPGVLSGGFEHLLRSKCGRTREVGGGGWFVTMMSWVFSSLVGFCIICFIPRSLMVSINWQWSLGRMILASMLEISPHFGKLKSPPRTHWCYWTDVSLADSAISFRLSSRGIPVHNIQHVGPDRL